MVNLSSPEIINLVVSFILLVAIAYAYNTLKIMRSIRDEAKMVKSETDRLFMLLKKLSEVKNEVKNETETK